MLHDETGFFPSAAAHAISILDDTKGSLDDAIVLIALNCITNPDEMDHWVEVLRALDGGAEA
jgi:hypothetical protein